MADTTKKHTHDVDSEIEEDNIPKIGSADEVITQASTATQGGVWVDPVEFMASVSRTTTPGKKQASKEEDRRDRGKETLSLLAERMKGKDVVRANTEDSKRASSSTKQSGIHSLKTNEEIARRASDLTETSVGEDKEFRNPRKALAMASEATQNAAWPEQGERAAEAWEGESGRETMKEDLSTLGGMTRPEAAYRLLRKRFDADDLQALTDIITYEFMLRQAIPGKTFRGGVVAILDKQVKAAIEGINHRMDKIIPASGRDEVSRQQLGILETKFSELERMMAERNADEIRILEMATDIIAREEAQQAEYELVETNLLETQQKRSDISGVLDRLKSNERVLEKRSIPEKPKRSTRRLGLF